MREYIHQEVQNRQAFGRLTILFRFVKNWALRNDLKKLLRFSDYQLRDMGITRGELCRLLDLPPAHDIAWELERTSAKMDASQLGETADAGTRPADARKLAEASFTGRTVKA